MNTRNRYGGMPGVPPGVPLPSLPGSEGMQEGRPGPRQGRVGPGRASRLSSGSIAFACRFACFLACLLFASCAASAERAMPPLAYYYLNYCDSCAPEVEFAAEFELLTGKTLAAYSCNFYNFSTAAGRHAYESACESLSLQEPGLPLLILDGEVYAGTEDIRASLPAYFVTAGESTASSIYYLYVPVCENCARVRAMLDALPGQIEVVRGDYAFLSEVNVIAVNITDETGLAYALFDAYGVPDDKRTAPMLLAGETFYQGTDRSAFLLKYGLARGMALNTRMVDIEAPLPDLHLGITFTAGLVGGFNPCALSMLLLFLSLAAQLEHGGRLSVLAFMAAKFAVYLLIGTVLIDVFGRIAPAWLPLATKILLTAVSAVLVVLNLLDAWQLRQERYGKIRNQLPRWLRGSLNRRIKHALSNSNIWTPLVCAGLGIIVAAGEFLCAGQVYLATLLSVVRAGGADNVFGLLLAYCAGFLLPAMVLSAAALRGSSILLLSEYCRKRMPLIKTVTALCFIILMLSAWLL